MTALGSIPPAETAQDGRARKTAQEFEAVFLTQFVDEMMKTAGSATFGNEKQAEMWRSFMSDAVAEHLVAQGGLGLSAPVAKMIEAYAVSSQGQKE